MKAFMFVVAALLWVAAGFALIAAKTSIDEVVSCAIGVSGSVLFAGAAIVNAIETAAKAKAPESGSTSS